MKKLLMLMIVVACASFAHAAQFVWSSDVYTLVDKDGAVTTSFSDGGSIVLALLGTASDFSDATVLQTGTVSTANKSKGRVSSTYTFVYNEGSASNPIETGDILAVLYYKDGEFSKLLDASGESPMYTEYTVSGLGNNSWTGAQYIFATGNFQEPVPEPTSGLLLMVGGALLALRRKQK